MYVCILHVEHLVGKKCVDLSHPDIPVNDVWIMPNIFWRYSF